MTKLEKLQQWIEQSHRIVFLGGAGVSTESGIPDFRSTDGLYSQHWKVPPETLLSHTYFEEHPDEFYRFYREKMLVLDKHPNKAHLALARLEEKGHLTAVVTQNIDGLHQAAGSRRVLELHGSIHRNYCRRCGRAFDAEYIRDSESLVPLCPCGGTIKPDVVLYGEALPEDVLKESVYAISRTDLLIVGGTSLTVYPAAGLIRYMDKGRLVILNRDATPQDSLAELVIHAQIGEILGQLNI